jgi:hypothetical protein
MYKYIYLLLLSLPAFASHCPDQPERWGDEFRPEGARSLMAECSEILDQKSKGEAFKSANVCVYAGKNLTDGKDFLIYDGPIEPYTWAASREWFREQGGTGIEISLEVKSDFYKGRELHRCGDWGLHECYRKTAEFDRNDATFLITVEDNTASALVPWNWWTTRELLKLGCQVVQ